MLAVPVPAVVASDDVVSGMVVLVVVVVVVVVVGVGVDVVSGALLVVVVTIGGGGAARLGRVEYSSVWTTANTIAMITRTVNTPLPRTAILVRYQGIPEG